MAQPLFELPVEADASVASLTETIVAWARLLVRRRVLWLSRVASQPQSGHDGLSSELVRVLTSGDDPSQEATFCETDPEARSLTKRIDVMRRTAVDGYGGVVSALQNNLCLEDRELDLLFICVAADLEPELGGAFAFSSGQSHRRQVTERMAARLCGHGRLALSTPSGALRQWALLTEDEADPGEPVGLRADPFIVAYLLGHDELDPSLLPLARLVPPRAALQGWPVEDIAGAVSNALTRGLPSRIHIIGSVGGGRRTFAALVAAQLGARLLDIDVGNVAPGEWHDVKRRARRQALLEGYAIAWRGLGDRDVDDAPAKTPLEFVIAEDQNEVRTRAGWHERTVALQRLTADVRATLWRRLLPDSQAWQARERIEIAERVALSVGEIAHIAEQGPEGPEEVARRARELTRGRLGELGKLIECPFARDDLRLPQRLNEVLDDFLFEARERNRFWEDDAARRLFPRGTGLMALLSGPPGTGKTMAAQVIAAELGIDLFRIDLASMVSKYIGETSKNLRRLFARAKDMNALLLFDEADALFSKRTEVRDAHDRHSNADTNYLLQLIEEYPGIALLATNRRQNMDEAFVRRIRYSIHFPRPDAEQRREIWLRLVRAFCNVQIDDELTAQIDLLARSVEATGAQIKNAVLAAAFMARRSGCPMGLEQLYAGLSRELGNGGMEIPKLPSRDSHPRRAGAKR